MRNPRRHLWSVCCLLAAWSVLSATAHGQDAARRRGGPFGDWVITMDFEGRQVESILSFARTAEGARTAWWISFWGMSELKDVTVEDGRISFVQVRRNRAGEEVSSKFTGTIQEDKLTGTIASEMGSIKMEGTRAPRLPRAVGTWEIKFTAGERERTGALIITADKEGALAIQWPSERITHTITDITFERGTLRFKSAAAMGDRTWESTFEGTLRGDTLEGNFTSPRGEMEVTGTRAGGALIGAWNLTLPSERGPRMQRLQVHPDMSGRYGALPVKKITLDGEDVSFTLTATFGDRTFESRFKGTLKEGKLTGELTSERGVQQVSGVKVADTFMRRSRPQP